MEIPDLQKFPSDHPPSPYNFPLPLKSGETWGVGCIPEGTILVAVGWLGTRVSTKGGIPDDVVETLLEAYEQKKVFSDGTAGWHDCELCPGPEAWYSNGQVGPLIRWRDRQVRLYGHGHYLLRHENIIYMAPALILHYILDHGYRPPQEFLEAATAGRFLLPEDLIWEPYSPEATLLEG